MARSVWNIVTPMRTQRRSARRLEYRGQRTVAERPEDGVGRRREPVDERERGDVVAQRLEHGDGLEASQRGARADVGTRAEREVLARAGPVEPERVGLVVHALVAVGRRQ